jgi:phospholipase/carboxylesterase
MNLIQTSLVHRVVEPVRSGGGKSPALVLLHGRGADEHDLLGLAEYFSDRLFILSARAPFKFQWGGGFAWYDILQVGQPEPRMFMESYSKLMQFLEDIRAGYPIDPAQIFIGGFSMGTIMSFAVTLANPEMIAGVLGNSGLIIEQTELVYQWQKMKDKPVFLAHGIHDQVIPVSFARRAKKLLDDAHAALEYHEYPFDHQISEESLEAMANWLEGRLETRGPDQA